MHVAGKLPLPAVKCMISTSSEIETKLLEGSICRKRSTDGEQAF